MGVAVLDSGVLIAVLDADDAHHGAAREALTDLRERGEVMVLPASVYAEALVGPMARGEGAVEVVDDFVARLPLSIEPMTVDVARVAARLRARHGGRLRLPDALVVATAEVLAADVLITTDRDWPSEVTDGGSTQLVCL